MDNKLVYTDYEGKGGIKFDEIKVVSAYGKESMQNLIDSSRVQYIELWEHPKVCVNLQTDVR